MRATAAAAGTAAGASEQVPLTQQRSQHAAQLGGTQLLCPQDHVRKARVCRQRGHPTA